MAQSQHDQISTRIAKKEGVEYNKGPGPDVIGSKRVIEVATSVGDLKDSKRQLQGYNKPRYLATSPNLVEKAREVTKGTGIGVMDRTGKIIKPAGGSGRQ